MAQINFNTTQNKFNKILKAIEKEYPKDVFTGTNPITLLPETEEGYIKRKTIDWWSLIVCKRESGIASAQAAKTVKENTLSDLNIT